MPQPLRLRKRQRIHLRRDFDRIFRRRCVVSSPELVMHADDNDLDYARVAIRAGKRVGGAVVRNREKRMLREAFRVRQHELPAIDMICSVRATDVAVADYARALLKLSREAARKLERSARGRG